MNLNHLYYFRTLAKEQHYTRAAHILNITQPSLSHAINALEKELNVKLFEKIGRNARLTKEGELFCRYVIQSLDMLDEGRRVVGEVSGMAGGYIDIGYIYTLGSHFIPQNMSDYMKENEGKNIRFSFGQGTTEQMIEELKKGTYDLVFSSYKEGEDRLNFIPVVEEELVLITPKGHPLAEKEAVDLAKTTDYPYIMFSRKSGLRPFINKLFAEVKAQPFIAYEGEEDSSVAGLVAAGLGISIVPRIPILETMEVVTIPIKRPEIKRYIYLVTQKDKYLSPIVEDFIGFIKSRHQM